MYIVSTHLHPEVEGKSRCSLTDLLSTDIGEIPSIFGEPSPSYCIARDCISFCSLHRRNVVGQKGQDG